MKFEFLGFLGFWTLFRALEVGGAKGSRRGGAGVRTRGWARAGGPLDLAILGVFDLGGIGNNENNEKWRK